MPLFNLPTREDYNCSSLIDNIWTNITSKSFSGVLNSSITDHYPIFSVFENFKYKTNEIIKVTFRDLSSENIAQYRNILSKVD